MTEAAGGRSLVLVPAPGEPEAVRSDTVTKEVGWLLMIAGVVGVVMPGIPGTPPMIIGLLVVLSRLSGGDKPPGFIKRAMTPVGRSLDNLERRYPLNAATF